MTTTMYAIQVMDEGFPKLIPHTGKKNFYFLDRKKAIEFMNKLKAKQPDEKFRLLKRTETYKTENWQ